MKIYSILLISFVFLCSCAEDDETQATVPISSRAAFPTSPSATSCMADDDKYQLHNGTLLIISEGAIPHIQVSNLVLDEMDNLDVVSEVKRNIVYAAFKILSKTNIENLKVTSVPLRMTDDNTSVEYLREFEKTFTIHRKTGSKVIQQFYDQSTYRAIYSYSEEVDKWELNQRFRELQYEFLNESYRLLVKEH